MIGYRVTLTPDDNDTVMLTCSAFPEGATFGDDEADALRHGIGFIEEAIADLIYHHEDVPAPVLVRPHVTYVSLPTLTVLKVQLYRALRESGITRPSLAAGLAGSRSRLTVSSSSTTPRASTS
jgi:antitoxin HicB